MELCLEITETTQCAVWEQTKFFSSSSTRFQGYINLLALSAFLPWLQKAWEVQPNPNTNFNQLIWEIVNGTVITIEDKRLVLIPTSTIDTPEIRVPQEWVDISSWIGDYYLGVQVNIEQAVIKIWGYTTHLQIKQQGNYNSGDRTYSLDAQFLNRDINLLWITHQLCPTLVTKSVVDSLPDLSLAQVDDLLQTLGNPNLAFPRRAVPFSSWAALLENEACIQRLCQLRLGLADQ